ncbi:ComEA family DNA-binding protein [Xanthomonas sp. 60]
MPGVFVVWAWVLGIWFALALDAGRVDINQADAAALQELTMIGPGRAEAIIRYRRQHGSFQRIEDLMQVKGIGKAIVERNRQRITLEGREPLRDPAPGPASVRSVPRR